ncbi:MAG: transposase [Geminicoccaceae bacterium]
MGGNRRCDFAEHREALVKIVDERADRTIDEISAELARRGMAVSHGTIFNWLARIGLTFKKKTLFAVEKQARQQPPQTRVELRQDFAKPVFDELEAWLPTQLAKISGKSELAKAIRYASTRMKKLRPYL